MLQDVIWSRLFVGVMVVLLAGLLGCAAWGVAASAGGAPAAARAQAEARPDTESAPPPPPAPVIALTPGDGTRDLAPGRPVSVVVDHGRIATAALAGPGGAAVPGTLSRDGHRWTATGPLRYDTTYSWSGSVTGESGAAVPLTGSFSTVAPARLAQAHVNIDDNDTVGIAAPIEVQFDRHVTDKAAAERAMQVTTSVPTVGSWAWLDDDNGGSRAHWRPREYWASGTKVDLTVHQLGVNLGGGVWGRQDVSSHFTIGRAQIVKADVNSHQMVVVRDGKEVMNFPASYGLGSDPNRNTTNGIHVVMSKDQTVLMSNPKYGYVNEPEHWAVRIHNNGEFIHANPNSVSAQGNENVTHGCVNLSTADAQAYFDTAIFGDPVEVTNSPIPLTPSDGDISDWTVPWNQWQEQSALRS